MLVFENQIFSPVRLSARRCSPRTLPVCLQRVCFRTEWMNPACCCVHLPALFPVWLMFCVCVFVCTCDCVQMVIDGTTPPRWQSESLLTQIGRDPGQRNPNILHLTQQHRPLRTRLCVLAESLAVHQKLLFFYWGTRGFKQGEERVRDEFWLDFTSSICTHLFAPFFSF